MQILSIITCKFRLAAAAAIHFPARCHHWQRPLPIMSPPAANLKSMPLFPLRCLPLPVCRAPTLLNAPHFARHQQCSPACHHFFCELFADSANNSFLSSKKCIFKFVPSLNRHQQRRCISCHSWDTACPRLLCDGSPFKVTYGRMRIIIFFIHSRSKEGHFWL